MGLFERLRNELIDIIEWLDQSNDTIAYRFERFQNEIKMGAQLIVRPGQKAVFVNQGQVADVFDPGQYELVTQNLPILSTLQGWRYGFESPFKAEVYFFNTKVFTDLKWGTANPITLRDPELGMVRLRAYGSYTFRVANPAQMLEQIVSTDGLFQIDEIQDQIRNMILTGFASWVGQSNTAFMDFAARYQEFGETIRQSIQADIQAFGLELQRIYVENISLPPEVEQAIDRRNAMGILGNMQQYTQYQAANAIEASAENPSGRGNPGLDLGVGLAMGQQFVNAMQPNAQAVPQATQPAAPATPPPPPPVAQWHLSRNGQTFGPFPADQLVQNGLTAETYVWRSGMSGWQRAAQVPELSYLLTSPPPPPPVG
ncbi:MAG: SPFH domain-containing protein [Elainellaceae cyanobacterium]